MITAVGYDNKYDRYNTKHVDPPDGFPLAQTYSCIHCVHFMILISSGAFIVDSIEPSLLRRWCTDMAPYGVG